MKALLMHRDRDFDLQQELPRHGQALIQDLELDTLLRAMAGNDELVFKVARTTLLCGLQNDKETVLYRQAILEDCLKHPEVVRQLYALAIEGFEGKKKNHFGFFSRYPGGILSDSIALLRVFIGVLRKMRELGEEHASRFESEGFAAFFSMLRKELADDYFDQIENHLMELGFRDDVLVSARLGASNESVDFMLHLRRDKRPNCIKRIFRRGQYPFTVRIHERDEAGSRALGELRNRGLDLVANTLAQSADHIQNFFDLLKTELAFYIGCLNLHEKLASMGAPTSFPQPQAPGFREYHSTGLYDICLALMMGRSVVGNMLHADGKSLVIITGANQGGKSCFLRGLGLAQMMMHCGMFVAAESFSAELCTGLFTHFKREEDVTMKSGKLDEELARISDIVDYVTPNSLLLFNESFAATNEREGSEIARQIVSALLEKRIRIFFVTHLYEFAHGFFDRKQDEAVFLRAERKADGTRTFKLIEGEPMQTSYGIDLYHAIFEADNH